MKTLFLSGRLIAFVCGVLLLMIPVETGFGQITSGQLTGSTPNQIRTSVPFLTIAPDGRAAGMGDVGAASAPDLNSQHWNVAKYVFLEEKGGIVLNYSPWIPEVLPDINLFYAAGGFRINEKNALSASFRYFTLGTISNQYHPKEMAMDVGYSRKITGHFSAGAVIRYIRSDLTSTTISVIGTSVAGDLGLYYQNRLMIRDKTADWALGIHFSNMGKPVSYSPVADATPIPANLRIGGRFGCDMNSDHTLSLHLELNKLLVPTPPVYEYDSLTGEMNVVRGMTSPRSVPAGMIHSFYDAPGVLLENGKYSVFTEEIHEITLGTGVEYLFRNSLALRTGYFHEHASKGNRKYFTFGIGYSYRFLLMDVSYLLPVEYQHSYLKNTFRFTMDFAI